MVTFFADQSASARGRKENVFVDAKYSLIPARPKDIDALEAIERAAAVLLDGHAPAPVLAETTERCDFEEAQTAGRLWVALLDDTPVGFAYVEMLSDGLPHLQELDVDPRHGRVGIGTALVRTVCAWAENAGYSSITLTTFRHLPWNMPFYARLGFEEVPSTLWSPELLAIVQDETARGLEPETRAVMRYQVAR